MGIVILICAIENALFNYSDEKLMCNDKMYKI